jgi:hypothetical protein
MIINGLSILVEQAVRLNPMASALFVFGNPWRAVDKQRCIKHDRLNMIGDRSSATTIVSYATVAESGLALAHVSLRLLIHVIAHWCAHSIARFALSNQAISRSICISGSQLTCAIPRPHRAFAKVSAIWRARLTSSLCR